MNGGDFVAQSPDRVRPTTRSVPDTMAVSAIGHAPGGYGGSSPREATAAYSRIRLRRLSCFVVVAQERTLARAAARLHLSQPAVSKTPAELEDLAGRRLV